MPTIHQTTIVALLAAFIILFLSKTGLRDRLRDYHDKIELHKIAEMLDCDFCFSFWMCLCIVLIACVLGYKPSILVILCAPPITRYLL